MASNCLKKRKMPRVKHLYKQLKIALSCVGLPGLALFASMYVASLKLPSAVQPIKIGFILIQVIRASYRDIEPFLSNW